MTDQNDYTFGEILGKSFCGMVYRGVKKSTGLEVAIKKPYISPFPTRAFSQIWQARKEIEMLRWLTHENIVAFIGAFDFQLDKKLPSPCAVIELCEMDLDEFISNRSSKFQDSEIKGIISDILGGVEYLHGTAKVVHFDLKPKHIMRTVKGLYKITDFSMSEYYNDGEACSDYSKVTIAYRPPEILFRQPYLAPPVDMWSVGCIIRELLRWDEIFEELYNEADQFYQIIEMCGPPESEWPELSLYELPDYQEWKIKPKVRSSFSSFTDDECILDLVVGLLVLNPLHRMKLPAALTRLSS